MASMGMMILALPGSNSQDASPLWVMLPGELRNGFDNTIPVDVPGEHTHTDGSPGIGTPYNQFGRSFLNFIEKAVVYERNLLKSGVPIDGEKAPVSE